MSIHPTAIIEDGAQIGSEVEIGAYCHIGSGVTLGDGVRLHSHVVIEGRTQIGTGSSVRSFSVLGGPPQHTGYKGEDTQLIVGARSKIGEHVTMNTGTQQGGGVTRIGDDGMFMVGSHIGHDCTVGNGAIFANNATLGGHVSIGDHVFLGGLCAIHQNCRVGSFAFVGGCAAVPADVIPYGSATGNHASLSGLNVIGMKRRGMARPAIHAVRGVYRSLFAPTGTFKERLDQAREQFGSVEETNIVFEFIDEGGARALMTPSR